MLNKNLFHTRFLVLGIVFAVSLLFFPHEALSAAPAGSMTGFLYAGDMKTPAAGAVVKIRNVANGHEFDSSPSDATGVYAVKNIEEGQYVLGVSTDKGDFNFDYQISIKGGELAKLSLALKAGAKSTLSEDNQNGGKKKAFFLTPLGIALLVAAAAALIYGGYELFKGTSASPSKR
jgi:hypothetical protein